MEGPGSEANPSDEQLMRVYDKLQSTLDLIELMTKKDAQLTISSDMELFRCFFDIKEEHWQEFLDFLDAEVILVSSWDNVRNDRAQPALCAKSFLNYYGSEYWGKEMGLHHLLQERVYHSDHCLYPENTKALLMALELLILKSSRYYQDLKAKDLVELLKAKAGRLALSEDLALIMKFGEVTL